MCVSAVEKVNELRKKCNGVFQGQVNCCICWDVSRSQVDNKERLDDKERLDERNVWGWDTKEKNQVYDWFIRPAKNDFEWFVKPKQISLQNWCGKPFCKKKHRINKLL